MKENLKVVCVQAETYGVYDKEKNIQYHVDKILSLKDEKPDLVVFPELSISGYIRESNPETAATTGITALRRFPALLQTELLPPHARSAVM